LLERSEPAFRYWIVQRALEYANEPHPVWLLRARCERPDCSAADKRDERAPFHSPPRDHASYRVKITLEMGTMMDVRFGS
jgi:hypothetical protein